MFCSCLDEQYNIVFEFGNVLLVKSTEILTGLAVFQLCKPVIICQRYYKTELL